MPTSWFVCPYITFQSGRGPARRPKIAEVAYWPFIPNADGVVWEEGETLGNQCVVKVVGPDTALGRLRADSDFFELDPSSTIPPNRRNQVQNKLVQMGFTSQEVDATGYVITALLALLTTAAAVVGVDATGTTIEVKPGRKVAPKTVAQIEARLPG